MSNDTEKPPLQVGLISLGCAKNLVDSEIMLGHLLKDGLGVTNDPAEADVVIVNTCSFIGPAQQESVDAILQSSLLREAADRGQGLIVAGCLPQRFQDELPKLLPEVDAFMGIDQVSQVTRIVQEVVQHRSGIKKRPAPERSLRVTRHLHPSAANQALVEVHVRPQYIPDYATPRFRLTPRHVAYVKIAEGCNHPCSFCIIPRIRGSHRSRPQSDIVAEAKALLAAGARELNLISQDSTYYGLDLRPNHSRAIAAPERFRAAVRSLPAEGSTISSLLRELNALPGEFWIRLLYTHPAHWTEELIQTIAECPKVARYVDIPLQHIHQNMLERMRRETSRQYIIDLLGRLRAGVPGIALRTTFIVGFPGETDEYFEALLDFIRQTRFERLGVFAYSREEGTRAGAMAGQVPEKTKQQRRARAMAAQHEVAVDVSRSCLGRRLRVLVEHGATAAELRKVRGSSWEHGLLRGNDDHNANLKGKYLVARSQADAPDIDGRVYIAGNLPLGEFAEVQIVGHTDYDLIAEPVSAPPKSRARSTQRG